MNHSLLAFINSPMQMMVIAVLVLVLFGAKKLPLFARSLGRSLGEFQKAKQEFEQELQRAAAEPPPPANLPPAPQQAYTPPPAQPQPQVQQQPQVQVVSPEPKQIQS